MQTQEDSPIRNLIRRTADIQVSDEFNFSNLLLSDKLIKSLNASNFVKPSPIQLKVIPLARSQIDMILQAKSGTGKTIAFAICLLENYDKDVKFPQSLVIVPTREIAVQIVGVLNGLGKCFKNFKACDFIGGMDITNDRKKIQQAKVVVGTPGRLLHLIQSDVFNVSCVKSIVIDEADKLFAGGQIEKDTKKIISRLNKKVQLIATTATVSTELELFAKQHMKNPVGITPKREIPVLLGIKQFVRVLPRINDNNIELMNAKIDELVKIFNRISFKQCLLFTSSQVKTESYGNYLNKRGWKNEVINGSQDQSQRLQVLEKLVKFKCRILIATDLMARGIDIENVNLIINLDLPYDGFTYLHRIGRAGRFGTHGIAISLLNGEEEMGKFQKLLCDIGGENMKALNYPDEQVSYDFWDFSDQPDIGALTAQPDGKKKQIVIDNLALLDITKRLIDEPKQDEMSLNLNDILDDYNQMSQETYEELIVDPIKASSDSGVEDIFMKTIQELNLYNKSENISNESSQTSAAKSEPVTTPQKEFRQVIFKKPEVDECYSMSSDDNESDDETDTSESEMDLSETDSEDEDDEMNDADFEGTDTNSAESCAYKVQNTFPVYNTYVADQYSQWVNMYNFQLANILNYAGSRKY